MIGSQGRSCYARLTSTRPATRCPALYDVIRNLAFETIAHTRDASTHREGVYTPLSVLLGGKRAVSSSPASSVSHEPTWTSVSNPATDETLTSTHRPFLAETPSITPEPGTLVHFRLLLGRYHWLIPSARGSFDGRDQPRSRMKRQKAVT